MKSFCFALMLFGMAMMTAGVYADVWGEQGEHFAQKDSGEHQGYYQLVNHRSTWAAYLFGFFLVAAGWAGGLIRAEQEKDLEMERLKHC